MKKILTIAALLLFSLALIGQSPNDADSRYFHKPKDASISLSGNWINRNPYDPTVAGGLKMRYFVSKSLSFDSDLVIGKDYFHFGPGLIGLPLFIFGVNFDSMLNSEDLSTAIAGIVLMALSAEHLAYHIPVDGNSDISPYISVLRFKSITVKDHSTHADSTYFPVSFAAGIEINRYFKRFLISPYAEYNIAYDSPFKGLNFGINMGYYFPRRRD